MNKSSEIKEQNWFWKAIDKIEGDKVVWIILFFLTMISALAIFSSTSQLTGGNIDRIDLIREHAGFIAIGYGFVILLYRVKRIGVFQAVSQLGFLLTLVMLLLLVSHVDLGFLKAQCINKDWRTLSLFGFQIHVYEVAKVAMVMYLAWACNAYRQDQKEMEAKGKSNKLFIANRLARINAFNFMAKPFAKRAMYMYMPALVVCALTFKGSNSSAIFLALVMLATLLLGGIPFKEILLGGVIGIMLLASTVALHYISGGVLFKENRIETMINRIKANYDIRQLDEFKEGSPEWIKARDALKQPYTAKIAIHEGGLTGKGSGNSTQKHVVSHIYSDYMFSFLVEEYGLLGGIFVLILFVSLLARGSMITRLCNNEFAQIAVGGLTLMISCQAFMHILVNVGLFPMTGQTLPLISDGSFAFIVFCIAFGIILSISRIVNNQIRKEEEEAAPLYENNDQ